MPDDLHIDLPDLGALPDISLDDFAGLDVAAPGDPLAENRYIIPRAYTLNPRHIIYDNAQKLASETDLTRAQRYDVIIGGTFIFGDFIEAFLTRWNVRAERLIINTLSLSQENVDSLANLQGAGYIGDLELVISDYFFAHERHRTGLVPYIYDRLDDGRFQMAVCHTHMKTVCLLTERGTKIVIHGSANLRSSGNIEQFTLERTPDLYDFYTRTTDLIAQRYATINKRIPRKQLFNLIKQKGGHT